MSTFAKTREALRSAGGPPPAPARPAAATPPPAGHRGLKDRLYWAVSDTLAVTQRNLIAYTRIPEMLVFSSIQPIMFVLLFRYVMGGAIHTEGYSYVGYLMPGIFVQTVCFGAMATGIGLAEDLGKGLVERFRSLPMARSAVLGGRTTADLCRNVFVVLLMTVVGVAVGFRSTTGFFSFMAGVFLLLAFAYALSWGSALIGLSARNAETAQAMAFPLLFPMTFASSAFVPVASMPGWLQAFARNQPVSVVIDACRHLMVGGPLPGSLWKALLWTFGMMAVFAPLAVRKYRKVG
ncbi:MAG TPA: ABC transporter permease [Acidimicrobiia bacterium]|nr:ABC transporter permease [Acidimicrobiia bacterium]